MDIKGDLNRIGKDNYGYLQDISEGYLDGLDPLPRLRSVKATSVETNWCG